MSIDNELQSPILSTGVSYGYDKNLAEHLGLEGDGALNYEGLARHFVAANNAQALKDLVEHTDSTVTTKTAAEEPPKVAPGDGSAVGEHPREVALGEGAPTKVLEDADEDEIISETLKALDGGKFKNLTKDLGSAHNPLTPDFEILGDTLGLNNPRGVADASAHPTFVKDLQGIPDRSAANDPAFNKLEEGINRALNLMVRHKAFNKGLQETPTELVSNMSLFLANEANLRKTLDAYRKAGNFRHVHENASPAPRVKSRNDRYMKIDVPHADQNMSEEGNAEATRLREELNQFMKAQSKIDSPHDKVRIMILEASWAKGIRAAGEGSSVAAILSIGNKKLLDPSQLRDATSAETVKTAASFSDAAAFLQRHSDVRATTTTRGTTPKVIIPVLTKWLLQNFLEGSAIAGVVVPMETLNKIHGLKPDQLKSLRLWIRSSGRDTDFHGIQDVTESIEHLFGPIAKKFSDSFDEYFYDLSLKSSDAGFESTTKAITKAFIEQLPHILVRMVREEAPENIAEWITADKAERTMSESDILAALRGLVNHLVEQSQGAKAGEQWNTILSEYNSDPTNNSLVHLVEDWGKLLAEGGRSSQGTNAHAAAVERAKELVDKIIRPSILNGAPTRMISTYVENGLKSKTGNLTLHIPSVRKVKTLKKDEVLNGHSPFAYLVYVTGDVKVSGLRQLTPVPGHMYDLCFGEFSRWTGDEDRKGKKVDPSISMNMGGYILKVFDGRWVVTEDEALLSSNEIPRFVEFATKYYIQEKLEGAPDAASDVAGSNEDGELQDIISTIDNDTYQQLTSDMKDPLFDTALNRALRGKNTKEITNIFKYIDKQKQGLLKKTLQEHYGKELAFDDDGNVVSGNSMHYRALRGDEDATYHDPTDLRVQRIAQGFSEQKPSLKGYDPTGKKPDEVLKYASTSKEVSEQFLKNMLKSTTNLSMKNHYSLMKALFEEALTSCMKKYGLTHYIEQAQGVSNETKHFSGNVLVKRISDMVKDANRLATTEGSYAKAYGAAWERARNADPSAFDKLFKPARDLQIHSSTLKLKKENIEWLLHLLAAEVPNAENSKGFSDVMQKTSSGWEVMAATESGKVISLDALRKLANEILSDNAADALKVLDDHGVTKDFIPEKNLKETDAPRYVVKADADPQDLVQFMKDHDATGDIGQIVSSVSGKRHTWYSLASGVSGSAVRHTVAKEVEDPTKARDWGKRRDDGINAMLDSFKDDIQVNPEMGSLLADGKDFHKALSKATAYESKVVGTSDLTKFLIGALKTADRSIETSKAQQITRRADAQASGKAYSDKVNYDNLDTRVLTKYKSMLRKIHGLGTSQQNHIKELLKECLVKPDGSYQAMSDPYLSQDENNKVLIKLLGIETVRPQKGLEK